jgi:hypothetical protein
MAAGAGLCHHFRCSRQPLDVQRDPASYQCCFYVSRKHSRIGCDRVRSGCPFWGVSSRDLAPLRRGFLRLRPSQVGGSAGHRPFNLAADPDPPCAASVDFGASGRAQTGGDHDTLTTNSPRFVAPYWPSGYKGRRSDLVSSHTRGAARSSRWPRDFVPMRDRPALPPG